MLPSIGQGWTKKNKDRYFSKESSQSRSMPQCSTLQNDPIGEESLPVTDSETVPPSPAPPKKKKTKQVFSPQKHFSMLDTAGY